MNHPFPAVRALGGISRHFWQLRGVARCMDADLSAAMASGRLSDTGYAAMVTRCRACGYSPACMNWLACQQGIADAPPAGCANAEELIRLKS